MSTQSPFNEAEISSLLTQMYKLILLTHNISDGRLIVGPHQAPDFNAAAFRDVGISETAVSLLSQIPYMDIDHQDIAPDTRHQSYLANEQEMAIEAWRDPFGVYSEDEAEKKGYLEPWCVPLTEAINSGVTMILDTKTNEIFEVTWLGLDNPDAPNGAPDHFYRHFPSGPAPIILEKWIESYRYLNYVPTFLNSGWWFGADGEYGGGDKYEKMKEFFLQHGWPDEFREEDFQRDLEPFLEAINDEDGDSDEAIRTEARRWAENFGER